MATARNKIGFHLAEGGDPTGIGDWMQRLNEQRIPFFIKTADSMRGLDEAQDIVRQNQAQGIDVPHVSVFRRSGQLDGDNHFDIPRYDLEPEAAAAAHWQLHKPRFPANLDPAITWVETINEVRKEVNWCDWLGKFAWHTAQRALADGYKFAAFGFSAGTPDVTQGAWETDGMLQYLELCAEHPRQFGVALHEYSYSINDIWREPGFLVGGFKWLFRAADKHGIPRPRVLITEWGWEYNNVPDVPPAMQHIREVAEMYAQFPEVLGAAIWYLGSGYGDMAQRAQKLIQPVRDFTLAHPFTVVDESALVVLPGEEANEGTRGVQKRQPRPPRTYGARFVAHGLVAEGEEVEGNQLFRKTWRVQNSGDLTWDQNCTVRLLNGRPMTKDRTQPVPDVSPGQESEITVLLRAPQNAGTYSARWQLHDPNGEPFGDKFTVAITVPEPEEMGSFDSIYVNDVTIPDNSVIVAGSQFVKTWRARNIGERTWKAGCTLVHHANELLDGIGHPVPAISPGAEGDLSVTFRAPGIPGIYRGDWMLADPTGQPFGDFFFVLIQVVPAVHDITFMNDVTIPDGKRMQPGETFTKTWAVRNNGNTTWEPGFAISFAAGIPLTPILQRPLPLVSPGALVELSLELIAPTTPGIYRSDWRLLDPQGNPFGQFLWTIIEVV